jgi:TPR repeat protein
MYDHGVGVAQDDAEAVRLYSLAAEQNYFHAKYQLDCMHRDGRGGA